MLELLTLDTSIVWVDWQEGHRPIFLTSNSLADWSGECSPLLGSIMMLRSL